MGSCVSIHKNSASALKLQMTTLVPENIVDSKPNSIPSTPVKDTVDNNNSVMENKDKTTIVDPRIFSLRNRHQASRLSSGSVGSYRSFGGSREETFYDTQAWLESDCDDDFYSVNGDFASSRGSTPTHSAVGTPSLNRVFSPQVSWALLDGRPPLRNGSNLSRGSTPAHQRNSSSPQITGTYPELAPTSNPGSIKKKKKLADLFRESIRERAGEFLAMEAGLDNQDNNPNKDTSPNSPASVLPPRPGKKTPQVSGPFSQCSSGKITPSDEYFAEREKPLKSPQCCFPRLVSIRSYRESRKGSNPSTPSNVE